MKAEPKIQQIIRVCDVAVKYDEIVNTHHNASDPNRPKTYRKSLTAVSARTISWFLQLRTQQEMSNGHVTNNIL